MSEHDKNPHDGIVAAESDAVEIDASTGASDGAGGDGTAQSDGDLLRAELEKLSAELDEQKQAVLRARAEVENVRKRAQRDVEAAHRFGLERFLGELLAVKDSMDLGQAAASQATDVESLREGVELTRKMFDTVLEKAGVEEVNPVGEKFDPEFHQAMSTEVTAEAEAGTVVRVMQKGYLLNDRLLRAAMVIVAKAPAPETGGGA